MSSALAFAEGGDSADEALATTARSDGVVHLPAAAERAVDTVATPSSPVADMAARIRTLAAPLTSAGTATITCDIARALDAGKGA